MRHLVPLMVAIPLAGGFFMPLVAKITGPRRAVAIVPIAMAAGLLAIAIALAFGTEGTVTYWAGGWQFPIGISMVVDGFSRLMLLVVATVSLMALLFSAEYMARYTGPGLYYSLFLLMLAGMNGVVISGDLFNMFVFIEVAGIASYALVAFGTEADELEAGLKYLVLGTVGSTFLLGGIALIYNVTGHLNWAKVAETVRVEGGPTLPVYLAAAFFMMGLALKASMVPFHAWLPDAHPSAPAPISAMLSGVLIKASGVYALARFVFSVFGGTETLGHVLMALGVVSMVVGVLLAVGQWDLKRLLAYSSISQMGYVVLALGAAATMRAAGTDDAIVALAGLGGLLHLVNHAVFKSLLFLCSGAIEYATGTRQLKLLGGLGRRMPVTAGCLRIAALSISGVPPLNGFWSKLLIVLALALGGHYAFAAVAVGVSVLTLLVFAKVQRYVLEGRPSELTETAREVPAPMCVAGLVLAVLCFATSLLAIPSIGGRLMGPAVQVIASAVPADRQEPPAAPDAAATRATARLPERGAS